MRNKDQKKGCCFVEFDSPQTASNILKNYNGEKIKNFVMKLNWVNSHSKDKADSIPSKKYTVYAFFNMINVYIDLCGKFR